MKLETRTVPIASLCADTPAAVSCWGGGDVDPLDEARLTVEQRGGDYGPPRENMQRIADLWHAQFGWDVKPQDVALAMMLVKTARLAASPDHRDSVVDLHGYAHVYWASR